MNAAAAVHARQNIGPGLGASEIAAALGLHPYKSTLRLWQEKVGLADDFEGNEFTEWGLAVEPALLSWYEKRHTLPGQSLWHPTESLYHQEHGWVRATPDSIVVEWTSETETRWAHGVQAKNCSLWSGKRWDKGPPDEVHLQCQWEMFVTGLGRTDVIAALGGAPPATWTVWRDEDIIRDLFDAASRFWTLVVERREPQIDASEDWRDYFGSKLARSNADGVVAPSNANIDAVAAELRSTRAARRGLEKREAELEHRIEGYLADCGAEAVETSEGVITWRERAGSTSWKKVAETVAEVARFSPDALAKYAEAHRATPTRSFNVPKSWKE